MTPRSFPALLAAALAAACSDGSGPAAGRWLTISAGAYHTCAIDVQHKAYCWGRNVYGAVGDGTTEERLVPTAVLTANRFDSITAGYEYTCALTNTGAAWCWGLNGVGQLGDGTTTNRLTPRRVAPDPLFRTISAGEAHTCGIAKSGTSYCWGAALGPRMDGSVPADVLSPQALGDPVMAQLSSGYEIACALPASGHPYCWGDHAPGIVLPDTTRLSIDSPWPIHDSSETFIEIGAGSKHACALSGAGTAWCWGKRFVGLNDTTPITQVLHQISGGPPFVRLAARSPAIACALTSAGAAWCWGAGGFGSLGNGTNLSSESAVAVAGGHEWREVSPGFGHVCGVTTDNHAFCWGLGASGQLGAGTTSNASGPAPMKDP